MVKTFQRLAQGGRIDRSKALRFSYDGRTLQGFAGDTVASALLANDQVLIGRSFKYHRPRGLLSAGVEEPNGLFTIGQAATQEPNLPGTTTELVEGLQVRSQNGRPSVRHDFMAITGKLSRFLSAGFYYKTFMGPFKGSWMFYEPFIRKAAGLGVASTAPDQARYETRRAFAEVLVIGSGPAGLAAALAASRAGARVLLVEQDSELGGTLLCDGERAEAWRQTVVAELASNSNVTLMTRTTALGLFDGNTVTLLERRDHLTPDGSKGDARQITTTLTAKAIVFATGALERPLVFANNDKPGVMLASAVKTYLRRFAIAPAVPVLVATNNDSAYSTALTLAQAGVVVTLSDLRTAPDAALVARAKGAGVQVLTGTALLDVSGGKVTTGAALGTRDGVFDRRIACGVIAVSGGWSPAVHLTSHTGIKPRFDAALATFLPGGFAAGHYGVGALMGAFATADCVAQGFAAGQQAAGAHGSVGTLMPPDSDDSGSALEPLWQLPNPSGHKAFLDFQNDVTTKDVAQAFDEGYHSVEHLKRYTTLGMGTDQGKTSNINALAIMAGLRDVPIAAAGTTTFRPPYTPVALGALAGRTKGHHFRPLRRSPLHDWNEAQGGVFLEAGPWLRCWYYKWAGADPAAAYVPEMELVRKGVGLADVSTLGKIDVQGPDAAEFVNRLYVNGFLKLPVGKARYGVMLTDDGAVLDDGTTTRLSENRFFMTTTTAQAGEVMSWLEFLLETAWTDLKVQVTSLTDQWAGVAVSGPLARKTLQAAFPGQDLGNEALPYMGCLAFSHQGASIRLIRLSFSGELAYEVYCEADFGPALANHLLAAGTPFGIRPYGLEALASLRIEKGHVAGLELDHRNTLDDLGLGKMAAKEKAYIGKELRQRPQFHGEDRWSLVGLECLEEGNRLHGGAILFAANEKIEGHGRGYITSVTWSTELKKYIALGLYNGGLKHQGEEIICASPVRGHQVRARIVSPHFIDQKGERLHV